MELHFLKRCVSSLNIFIWAIALCSHAACKSFAGLFVVRLILGICESSITPGFMIVCSMFYTRREYTARVGYLCKDCDQPRLTPFLPYDSSDEWNWCKIQVFSSSQPLINVCSSNCPWFHQFWLLVHTYHRV